MSDSRETEAKRKSRIRWVTLGEAIAIAALIVSAVGVWLSYRGDDGHGPSTIVEKRQAIPLTLRGKAQMTVAALKYLRSKAATPSNR